jgi:hypothetical protein
MSALLPLHEIQKVEKSLGVSALDEPQLVIGALAAKLVSSNETIARIVADTISHAGLGHVFNKQES